VYVVALVRAVVLTEELFGEPYAGKEHCRKPLGRR
jgi:hypothetical protein